MCWRPNLLCMSCIAFAYSESDIIGLYRHVAALIRRPGSWVGVPDAGHIPESCDSGMSSKVVATGPTPPSETPRETRRCSDRISAKSNHVPLAFGLQTSRLPGSLALRCTPGDRTADYIFECRQSWRGECCRMTR